MMGTAGPADFYIELKMVLCSAHDGVALKFKKKMAGPPVYQDGYYLGLILDPL
jgi:hypothetical protein